MGYILHLIYEGNLFLQNLPTLLEESLQKKAFDLFHVHLRPQDSKPF